VARSRNLCCSGNATIRCVCIFELPATFNNINVLSAVLQCFCDEFVSVAGDEALFMYLCNVRDIFCQILTKFGVSGHISIVS
jgi:hypothetical protein